MTKTSKLNKLSGVALALGVAVTSLSGSAFAQTTTTGSGSTATSAECAGALGKVFGCDGLIGGTINLQSIIAFVFRILLIAAILWVVYNIVMAGMKIAGAREDADKRKEGLKSVVNAAIGLVVSLSAFAITNTVAKQVGSEADINRAGIPCTGTYIPVGSTTSVSALGSMVNGLCKDEFGNTLTPAPTSVPAAV
jgi:membrane associated rhomboid family serine protease